MEECEAHKACAIYAEGKEHCLAVGLMKMSSAEIARENKGIGVDGIHYLNDGLWTMDPVN